MALGRSGRSGTGRQGAGVSQRIAVIGAGMVGLSTAEWLRRDGHAVTLIDRVRPGDPAQASFGNAGVLAASSFIPVNATGLIGRIPGMLLDRDGPLHLRWSYLPRLMPWLIPFLRRANARDTERAVTALATLTSDTVDQHRALSRGTPAERFIRDGIYATLYRSRAACEADAGGQRIRQAHGARIEYRDRERLLADDPYLGPAYGYAACHMDHGWITDPGAYLGALADWFTGQGGAFRQGDVAEIAPGPDGVNLTVAGEALDVDRAVVAGGAWSARLVRQLGHRAGLETERGYHVLLKNPSRRTPFPCLLADAKFVATPMATGLRLAGQLEYGGLRAGRSEAPFRLVHRRLRELYPDLEWDGEERWMGHRPTTIDSLPFIGPSPNAPRVHFAFGAQHIGLTAGPRTGRMIADQISGRTPNIELAPFRVGRFDR